MRRAAIQFFLAVSVLPLLDAATVPSGTKVEIRLTSGVNSAAAKPKDTFQAVVIAPVLAGDSIAIGQGTKVLGHVQDIKQAEAADQQTVLTLAFDSLQDDAGHSAAISAKLVAIDNARETIDADGRILGIQASQTGSARLDQGINKIAEKYPGFAGILSAAKSAIVSEADPSINYQPGVEMSIELTKPLDWNGRAQIAKITAISPADELADLVNRQPFRTQAGEPPKPSDMTNLMFLGSEDDIVRAFQEAGWSQAQQLSGQSKFETFKAMTEMRGYKEAPVSTLLLDGRAPDLVFEKANNTFASRHHMRVWRRPGTFNGKPVWVAAGTHDTGIDFSQENRTFIHKIDSEIDHERAKIVNDLLFTGLVRGLALVARPEVPTDASNATGDQLRTDGKMAVLG